MSKVLPSSQGTTMRILTIAAWFGLVTGLIEGATFLVLQRLNRVMSYTNVVDVNVEIIWIAALFDLLLFSAIGLALAAIARFFRRLPVIQICVGLFSFVALLNWLGLVLAGRFKIYAVGLLAVGLAVQVTYWFRKHEASTVIFWRKTLPWVGALALVGFITIKGGLWLQERNATSNLTAASPGTPNVLVIVLDTLRADHLSSYGYARATSPNLDRIAREGVLFENAFAAASYTLPSHASMLTGRYPHEHRVEWNNPEALNEGRHPTLAEALRSRGYRTGGFSANLFWFTRLYGFDRGFIHFEDYFESIGDMALRTVYGRAFESLVCQRLGFKDIPARRRAADINQSVLDWIDKDRGRPFFVFLNYNDLHDPYLPPQPYRKMFSSLEEPGGLLNYRTGQGDPEMTAAQLQSEIAAYDGAVAYVDHQIGLLFKELQNRGLSGNTLVLVTSDHGELLGEHGMFLHDNSLYREVIQVPLILWKPGQVPVGLRVGQPVTNAALAATVMELVGAKDQTLFPVSSLAQLWQVPETGSNWPNPLSEMAQKPFALDKLPVRHGSMKSLVDGQWHYIKTENLGVELYNWKDDPMELHNLAEKPEVQGILTQFR